MRDRSLRTNSLPAIVLLGVAWLAFADFLPQCLVHRLTGLQCPFCGMTRAARSLCSGEVEQSLAYNPLLLPTLAVLAVSIVKGGTAFVVWAGRLLMVALLCFTILRNLPT